LQRFKHPPSLDLSIVIVNYKVKVLLKECLTSILESTQNLNYEIIVVDNGSNDGSVEIIKRDFPEVVLLDVTENIGFVKGNNRAFKISRGHCILMLNPDTRIVHNRLHDMLRHFERRPDIGVIGCKMLYPDNTLQQSCYDFPSLREIFGMYFLGSTVLTGLRKMDYDREQEVDFVRGAFLAVRRSCLEKIGLLDEQIFMFGEETDLCCRVKENGWKVIYSPETVIVHHKSKSIEQMSDNMYVQRIRSLLYYFSKHYGFMRTLCLRLIIVTGIGLRFLFRKARLLSPGKTGTRSLSTPAQVEVMKLALGCKSA